MNSKSDKIKITIYLSPETKIKVEALYIQFMKLNNKKSFGNIFSEALETYYDQKIEYGLQKISNIREAASKSDYHEKIKECEFGCGKSKIIFEPDLHPCSFSKI